MNFRPFYIYKIKNQYRDTPKKSKSASQKTLLKFLKKSKKY